MALKELEARYATKRAKDYGLPTARGSKLWRLKCRSAGKVKLLAFGVYPAVSLAAGVCGVPGQRWRWGRARTPVRKDAPAAVTTFEQAARAWHTHRLAALDKRPCRTADGAARA